MAFFSGSNLPPALFLALYVFVKDASLAQTKLAGYEKYISGAGLVLFLVSLIGIWTLCVKAWAVAESTPMEAEEVGDEIPSNEAET